MTRDNYIKRWIIPALERTWNDSKCKEIIEFLEQKTCEDCISRQAVIDEIYESRNNFNNEFDQRFFADKIEALPPVNPQLKIGHWIPLGNYDDFGNESSYKCSECGDLDTYPDNFCPNCGVKMVEPQESEEQGMKSRITGRIGEWWKSVCRGRNCKYYLHEDYPFYSYCTCPDNNCIVVKEYEAEKKSQESEVENG